MKKDGVELFLPYENDIRVFKGYGVPEDHILRVTDYAGDTLEELTRVRAFADRQGWKKLIVVTSNFHTRRARLVARYVLEPEVQTQIVAASEYDSFDPDSWWTSQSGIRTLAIEYEKLLTYSIYIWPRLALRRI